MAREPNIFEPASWPGSSRAFPVLARPGSSQKKSGSRPPLSASLFSPQLSMTGTCAPTEVGATNIFLVFLQEVREKIPELIKIWGKDLIGSFFISHIFIQGEDGEEGEDKTVSKGVIVVFL